MKVYIYTNVCPVVTLQRGLGNYYIPVNKKYIGYKIIFCFRHVISTILLIIILYCC